MLNKQRNASKANQAKPARQHKQGNARNAAHASNAGSEVKGQSQASQANQAKKASRASNAVRRLFPLFARDSGGHDAPAQPPPRVCTNAYSGLLVCGLCTDNPARSIWILYLKESKRGGAKQSKATQRSAKKRKATLPNKDFRISHTHNG